MLWFDDVKNKHHQVGWNNDGENGQEHVVTGLFWGHRFVALALVENEAYVDGEETEHGKVNRNHVDDDIDESEQRYGVDDNGSVLALGGWFVGNLVHGHAHDEVGQEHGGEVGGKRDDGVLNDGNQRGVGIEFPESTDT